MLDLFFSNTPRPTGFLISVESVADEANTRKGAEVDLSVVEPVQVDLGLARFEGFERTNGQIWCCRSFLFERKYIALYPSPSLQFQNPKVNWYN